jgi:enamine deaminase RidA (YjgF/YER057c/UK114 family)
MDGTLMAKTIVNPPQLAKPSGFSHGIEARGRLLFLAGQTALDAGGRIVAPGDLVAQFRQALVNVATVIEARGGSLRDVVKLTFYVVDEEQGHRPGLPGADGRPLSPDDAGGSESAVG